MEKTILVGSENFEELIRENGFYVDKTEILYDLINRSRNKVTLFTRPRRFGKTLTLSMMESFFDLRRDSRDVFKDLRISQHREFCAKWMNQYPVLFLSFKDMEGLDFDSSFEMLKSIIAGLCKKHTYLMDEKYETLTDSDDREIFRKLKAQTGSLSDYKNSLLTIMRMMHSVFDKPVILLMDEYDVPLAKADAAQNPDYYRKTLDIIRGIMSISLKTNDYLKFAVITGCLRISKESIFTGVNNFACYSVMDDPFSSCFGFSQEEVEELLSCTGLSDKKDTFKEWYDGYLFGNSEVYCPWDVVSYATDLLHNHNLSPKNYWANTSGNTILQDFAVNPNFDVSDKFEALLNGRTIREKISQELTYDHLADSESNLWSVLLMTGYVSKAEKNGTADNLKIRIPNAEIATIFRDTVVAEFKRRLDTSKVDAFLHAMWNKEEEAASSALTDILWNSISYFDYAEEYYHGMLNGIFTSRGYSPDSNDESGLGRLDLRIRDKANRRILLLEFKRSTKEGNLDQDCDEAISQILRNGYAREMPDGYHTQLIYGIAFYGKKAKVKWMPETQPTS